MHNMSMFHNLFNFFFGGGGGGEGRKGVDYTLSNKTLVQNLRRQISFKWSHI